MEQYNANKYEAWDARGLKDFGEYADCLEYREQRGCYGDCLAGGWFYPDDEAQVIYLGTFGNDNSPGASHYTWAECYAEQDRDDPDVDERDDYAARVAFLEALPEYLDDEDDEDEADEAA